MNKQVALRISTLVGWAIFTVLLLTINNLYAKAGFIVPVVGVLTLMTFLSWRRLLIKFYSTPVSYENLGNGDFLNQYRMDLEAARGEPVQEQQLQTKYLNTQTVLLTLGIMMIAWYFVIHIAMPVSFIDLLSAIGGIYALLSAANKFTSASTKIYLVKYGTLE